MQVGHQRMSGKILCNNHITRAFTAMACNQTIARCGAEYILIACTDAWFDIHNVCLRDLAYPGETPKHAALGAYAFGADIHA